MSNTIRSVGRKASKSHLAWIIGLATTTAVAVGMAIYFGEKTAKAATPPSAPVPAPSGGTTPVWQQLQPATSGSAYVVNVPAGSTFEVSIPSTDPQAANIVAALDGLVTAGTITGAQAYQVGTPFPAGPADGLGTTAYRAVGVASQAFVLTVTQSTRVYVVTGYV